MKTLDSILYAVACVVMALLASIAASFFLGVVCAVLASAFESGWRWVR